MNSEIRRGPLSIVGVEREEWIYYSAGAHTSRINIKSDYTDDVILTFKLSLLFIKIIKKLLAKYYKWLLMLMTLFFI